MDERFLYFYWQHGVNLFAYVENTWIFNTNAESNQQVMKWCHLSLPKPKIICILESKTDGYRCLGRDERQFSYFHVTMVNNYSWCVPRNDYQTETTDPKSMRQETRSCVIHLQDHERPKTVALIQKKIQDFCFKLFDLPPYCPDLAPSDNLFCICIWNIGLVDNDELNIVVIKWLNFQSGNVHAEGWKELVLLYENFWNWMVIIWKMK